MEVVDIAGLVPGVVDRGGARNRFLAGIREVDALCVVLRAFEDPEVPGDTTRSTALATLELELVLADMATVESQLDKRRRAAKADKSLAGEVAAMDSGPKGSRRASPCTGRSSTADDRAVAQEPFPAHRQARARRGQPRRGPARSRPTSSWAAGGRPPRGARRGARACASSSRPRRRGSTPEERAELLEGLGLGEGAIARVAQARLRLCSGGGSSSPPATRSRGLDLPGRGQGARVRGGDPLRSSTGFIRAEVIHWTSCSSSVRGRRPSGGQHPPGGQGLRGPRRRRARDPLQRVRRRDHGDL